MSRRRALRNFPLVRAARWARILYRNMDRSRTFGLAAEMAFWLFLSLIPLAVVVGLAAAKMAMQHRSALAPMLAPLPGPTQQFITHELRTISAWDTGTVGPIAVLIFVGLASS